jgi:SAM-dependent methyltransferase
MRSVLHHIADIPKFFRDCARILAPGGLLLCEEPCQEGYVLMGAMTQMAPDMLKAKGVVLSPEQMDRIREFAGGMQFYARRDVDKSRDEDKHLFRPDELMSLCHLNRMEMHFFSNRTFADIHKRDEPLPSNYFEVFYFNYLKYCVSWDNDLLQLFSEHVRPFFDYFSCLAFKSALPHTYSTILCRKPA